MSKSQDRAIYIAMSFVFLGIRSWKCCCKHLGRIDCPFCFPYPFTVFLMKKCPFCSEEIQDSAKQCRHCGEWLIESENLSHDSNDHNSVSLGWNIQTDSKDTLEQNINHKNGISENDLLKTRLFKWIWKIWWFWSFFLAYSLTRYNQTSWINSWSSYQSLIGLVVMVIIWTISIFIIWKLIIHFKYWKIIYEKDWKNSSHHIRTLNKLAYLSIIIIIGSVSYIAYYHYKNIDAWYSLLQKQVSTTNASLPKMIDSDTRLDEQVVLKPANIQYKYTLVNTKKGDIDVELVKEKLSTAIMTNLPTTYSKWLLNTLVKIGANISLIYYDKEWALLFQIEIRNEQLSKIYNSI